MQPFSQAHHIKACLGLNSNLFSFFKPCLSKVSLPLLAISSILLLSSPSFASPNTQVASQSPTQASEYMTIGHEDPLFEENLLPEPKNIDANSNPEHEFVAGKKQSKQLSDTLLKQDQGALLASNTNPSLPEQASSNVSSVSNQGKISGTKDNSRAQSASSGIGQDSEARATNGSLVGENTKFITTTTRGGALSGGGITSTAGLIKWLLSTVAILGIIFVLAFILKKTRLVQRTTGSSMTLIGQMAVGPKERLVQIKVGERYLLLGVTPQNVNLVADLSDDFVAKDKDSSLERPRRNSNSKERTYSSSGTKNLRSRSGFAAFNDNRTSNSFFKGSPRDPLDNDLNSESDFVKDDEREFGRDRELDREQELNYLKEQAAFKAQKECDFAKEQLRSDNLSDPKVDRERVVSSLEANWDDPVFAKHLDGVDNNYRPNAGRYTKEQLETLGDWFESELDYHEGHNFDINNQQDIEPRAQNLRAAQLDQDYYDDFSEQDLDALYKEHLMASRARQRLSRRNPLGNDYYAMPNDDILKERAKRAKMSLAQSRKLEEKYGSDDFASVFNQAYDQAQGKLNIDPIVTQNHLSNPDLEQDDLVEVVSVEDINKHQELNSGIKNTPELAPREPKSSGNFTTEDQALESNEVEVDVLLAIDEAVENSKPIKNSGDDGLFDNKSDDLNQVVMIDDELNSEPSKDLSLEQEDPFLKGSSQDFAQGQEQTAFAQDQGDEGFAQAQVSGQYLGSELPIEPNQALDGAFEQAPSLDNSQELVPANNQVKASNSKLYEANKSDTLQGTTRGHEEIKSTQAHRNKYTKSSKRKGRSSKAKNFGL